MQREIETIAKTGSFYVLASAIPAIISILILPIYTHNLSSEDYGKLALAIALMQILFTILSLGLHSGMVRSYGLADDKAKGRIVSTALLGSAFLAGFALFLGGVATPLARWLLPFPEGETLLRLACVFCATNTLLMVYLTHLRLQLKASSYAITMVSRSILTLGSAYLLLVILRKGVIGAAWSQVIPILAILAVFIATDHGKLVRPGFSSKEAKEMLKFSLWLIPGNLAGWVLSLSDRYFLEYFCTLRIVGIYSFGYQIASLIEIGFKTPFALAWSPVIFPAFREGRGEKVNKDVFRYYSFIGVFLVLALSIFAKEITQLLSPAEYIEAYTIVPLVALGLFLVGWENFLGMGLYVANKTYYFPGIFGIGALANLGLNFLLIPRYGMLGAAAATLISYILVSALYYIASQREYPLAFEFRKQFTTLGVGLALFGIYVLCPLHSPGHIIGLKLLLLLAYLLLGIWLRIISKDEAKEGVKLVSRMVKRWK